MKPEYCDEIGQTCDFVPYWVARAAADLESKVFIESGGDVLAHHQMCIAVPSQMLDEAIPVAQTLGCNLRVDRTYKPDEWSIEGWAVYVNGKDYKTVRRGIWSPGA